MLNKKVRKLWRKVFTASVAAILIATTSISYSVVSFADAENDGGILFEELKEEEPEELQEPESETEVDEENDEEVKEPVEEAEEPAEEGKESAKEGEELAKEAEEVAETVDTEETNELEVEPIDGLAADSSAANPTRLMNGRALGATPSDSSSEISYELSTNSIYLGEVEQDSYSAYALQNTKYFTLKNTGTPVWVKYTYSDIFYINHGGHNEFSLDSGEEVSIDVSPRTGLKAGFYTETFEIQLESKKTRQDQVTFTVQASINVTEHTEDFTLTPSTVVFEDKVEGYTNGGSQTITIKNIGTAELNFEAVDSEHFMSNRAHNTVKPGEEKQFYVSPKSGLPVGTYNETITVMARDINHSDRKVNKDINLSFTVKEKVVEEEKEVSFTVTPENIAFGEMTQGYSSSEHRIVTLKNTGKATLRYILKSTSSFDVGSLNMPDEDLAPGEEMQIEVFPRMGLLTGTFTEAISVTGYETAYPDNKVSKSINLSVTVKEKEEENPVDITVTPSNVVFEEKEVGYGYDLKTITIKNTGTTRVNYGAWDSDSFKINGITGESADPGEEIQVTVEPKLGLAAGMYNETITIDATDAFHSYNTVSKDINLSFTVKEKAVETVDLSITPSDVVFTTSSEGYNSSDLVEYITLKNPCDFAVDYAVILPADSKFYLTDGRDSHWIAEKDEVEIGYRPIYGLEPGKYSETVTVNYNKNGYSSIAGSKTFTMSFTVTEKAVVEEKVASFTVTPDNFVFEEKIVGYDSSTKIITVKNTGTATLRYGVWDSDSFTVSGLTGKTAAPGEELQATVAPRANLPVGSYNETITIEAFDTVNTDKKVSKDINLSFKVLEKEEENPVDITVTPSNVVFEEEEVGYGYNLKTITIKNTGTAKVNYGAWDSDSFMINGLTGKSAEPDEEIQVTVQPKLGLEAGKYNETITIDATDAFHSVNKVTKDINLSFTVKEKAVETVDLSITPSDLVFTTSNEGYSKSDLLKYVTLKNPCDFSVYYSVILPTDSRFELMEGRLSHWIAADGSLEIGFAPKSGLAPGKYSETVTVNYHKSGYSIIAGSQTFKMYFTVTKEGEEPEREQVTEVTATSNISEIFKDGEAVIEPKFMVDGDEAIYFLNGEGVFSRWEKKDGDSWKAVDGADELFTPGEWRVKAPVWLDSTTSFLAQDAEVTVDGELWTTEAGEITDDYSFIWVTSPVFTIEDEKPERTEITEVTATSNIASITINGEDIKEPKFDITVGTEAHFTYDEKTMWLKKIDKDEWEEVTDGTFTPGTWQYKAKLIIDGEQAEQYYLGKFLTVTIDGEVWKGIGGYSGEDSSYVELISPDITISEDATMTEYEVEGDGQVFTKGDTNDITIRAMGDLDKLTSIKIDGKEIWIEGSVTDSALFSVVSGSTVLTLNNAYLNDTETGEHEVAFEYTDGYANAKFTVKDASSSGGSNDDPSQGGSNDNPSTGGSNDNPSTGGSNDNPSTGGSNDNPSTGGSNSGNQGGSSSSQPSQGSQSSSNNDAASSESTPAATPAQTAANANAAVLGETRDRAPEATAVTPAGTTATDNAAVLGETRSASTDDTSNAPLRMMIIMISVLGIAGIALAGKTKIKK